MPASVCPNCTAENASAAYVCCRCGFQFLVGPRNPLARRLLGLGLVCCAVLLFWQIIILASFARLTIGNGVVLSVIHIYFAYYYLSRIMGKEARLFYYMKTAKDTSGLVGQDLVAVAVAVFVLLGTFAHVSAAR
jgi:DNA-directed RNA polymerase subunit RPC12/RpoP